MIWQIPRLEGGQVGSKQTSYTNIKTKELPFYATKTTHAMNISYDESDTHTIVVVHSVHTASLHRSNTLPSINTFHTIL